MERWTGSNTNPPNNDGQGLQGTDRSNIIMLKERVSIYCQLYINITFMKIFIL
jgi:hypothetical protein